MSIRKVSFQIPLKDLEVYLAGGLEERDWEPSPSRQFREEEGVYALTLEGDTGTEFKCFVWVRSDQNAGEIRQALKQAGFKVTGEGDVFQSRIRLWFLIPGVKDTQNGVWSNNLWGSEETIIFPTDKGSKVRGTGSAPEKNPPR